MFERDDIEALEKYIIETDDVNTTIKESTCIYPILQNNPPLISIASFFAAKKCFKYLFNNDADLYFSDGKGVLPFHFAAAGGSIEICDYFDSAGIDFGRTDQRGKNSLHYACQHGKIKIVERFWNRNFDLNLPDNQGLKPIHYASYPQCTSVVDFLVRNNCNINELSETNLTPLLIALKNSVPVLKYLVSNGADTTVLVDDDRTPLLYASFHGNTEIVEILLSSPQCVNAINQRDRRGWTPLHYSCSRGDFKICQLLAEKGANLNALSSHGLSPAQCAYNRGHTELYNYLVNHGGDAQIRMI